jgi:hypothetical protein
MIRRVPEIRATTALIDNPGQAPMDRDAGSTPQPTHV